MNARAVAPFCLILLAAAAARAQAPTPPIVEPPAAPPQSPAPQTSGVQPGRVFCEQTVSFQLADSSTIPENFRRFVGVWSDAAWDPRTCAALIVQDVKEDGSASIIYIFGPQGTGTPGPGGVLHGTGVIRSNELRFQNSDGSQFAFRPGIVDMVGHLIDPKGQSFEATFKQTP
jgi:hypothetical protein